MEEACKGGLKKEQMIREDKDMLVFFQINEDSVEQFRSLFTESTERDFLVNPDILAVGAVDRLEPCGVMLLHVTENILYLTYLYVAENCRRKGVGSELLGLAEKMAVTNDMMLLAPFFVRNEEDALYHFFRNDSFMVLERTGSSMYRLPLEKLDAIEEGIPAKSGYLTVPFHTLSEELQDDFFKKREEEGNAFYDLYSPDYISRLCLAAVKEENLGAAAFVRPGSREDEILLDYVYSSSFPALGDLLREMTALLRTLPKKIRFLTVVSVNESAQSLIDYFIPDAEEAGAFYLAGMDI